MFDRFRNLFISKDIAPAKAERLASTEQSVAWSETSTILERNKWNPDDLIGRKGFQVYKDMMVDEQVKAVVHFKRSAIIGRNFTFDYPAGHEGLSEEEAMKRVEIMNKMITDGYDGEFADGLKNILKAMWQGFSMTELIFGKFEHDGKTYIGVNNLRSKPFDTFWAQVNEYGDVVQWVQKVDNMEQVLDMDRFVYYRYNVDMDEHYGRSELYQAYRSFLAKDTIIHYMNIFVERLAGGFIVMRPKDGRTLQAGTAEWLAMQRILKNITGKSSIILPDKIDLDVHTVTGNQVEVFARAIEIHDLAIAKALLMPNLLGLSHTGQTGAYSQSETQFDVFLIISDEESRALADALNEQVFQPLGKINFADGLTPSFTFKPLSDRKKMQLLETWGNLLQKGAVQATETDMDHVRELLDFPEAHGEPVLPVMPQGPSAPAPGTQPRQPAGQGMPTTDPREPVLNETIRGAPVRIVNQRTFARAEKRVAFNVIAKQVEDSLQDSLVRVEGSFLDMVGDLVAEAEARQIGAQPDTSEDIAGLSFNSFRGRGVKNQVSRALRSGFRIGEVHAKNEIANAQGEQFTLDHGRLAELAADYLDGKAFTIAGDLSAAALKEIKNILFNALKFSWSFRQIREKIYVMLAERGFIRSTSAAEALGLDDLTALGVSATLSPSRLETVMRTTMFEAINEARYNMFTDPALGDFVVALEYSAILDSRTTAICRHMDGRVYSRDDSVWDRYRPPNHFNCRSILIAVTQLDEIPMTSDLPSISPQEGFG